MNQESNVAFGSTLLHLCCVINENTPTQINRNHLFSLNETGFSFYAQTLKTVVLVQFVFLTARIVQEVSVEQNSWSIKPRLLHKQ